MPSVNAETDGFARLDRKLDGLADEIKGALRDAVNDAAETGRKKAQQEFSENTSPYGRGKGITTIRITKRAVSDDIEAIVSAGGPRTRESGFDYMLSIEFGARPHFPPVEAVTGRTERLDRWVRRMNPTPRTARQQDMSPEELRKEVALQIAESIARTGLDERPFMRPGFRAAATQLRKRVQTINVE